jgi:hypothetical protein
MFNFFIKIFVTIIVILFTTGCMSTMPYLKKPFPLVMQFNSYCCGVPDEQPIRDAIHELLIREKKSKLIAWKLAPMGKEGEYWICFQSDRTYRSLQHKLIDAIEAVTMQRQERGGITLDSNIILQRTSIPQQAKWESIWFE